MSPQPTPDLDRLLRWEESGGTWRLAGRRRTPATGPGTEAGTEAGEEVTLSLLTCDGGEEMDVLTSAEPELLRHVRSAGPAAR